MCISHARLRRRCGANVCCTIDTRGIKRKRMARRRRAILFRRVARARGKRRKMEETRGGGGGRRNADLCERAREHRFHIEDITIYLACCCVHIDIDMYIGGRLRRSLCPHARRTRDDCPISPVSLFPGLRTISRCPLKSPRCVNLRQRRRTNAWRDTRRRCGRSGAN